MKCLVVGASISQGYGLEHERLDHRLWVNQLVKNMFDKTTLITNISNAGDDNFQIFKKTCTELSKNTYNTVIVCWQNIPRTNYFFGLETYNTRFAIVGSQTPHEINLNNNTNISKSQLSTMRKNLIAYYNHHWDIANLVFYVNTLIQISKHQKADIRFINYNLPWNHYKFFDRISFATPSSLDPFTIELLQSDQRDDEESSEIYKMIHDCYDELGGIQENHWLNLYEPLRSKQVDIVLKEDPHPGYKSQKIFTDFLTQRYSESLTIFKNTL